MNSGFQKWGFGMAPVKEKTDIERFEAIDALLLFMKEKNYADHECLLESISVIKGMFSRVFRQDQWDWFTVFERLGRPGATKSRHISGSLKELRDALKTQQGGQNLLPEVKAIIRKLKSHNLAARLLNYKGADLFKGPFGQIYILSTRDQRNVLKIGYTERSVAQRTREINSATGILIPFGVRAVWAVKTAQTTEQEIHRLFSKYRIREDREFFDLDFDVAFKIINAIVKQKFLEPR